MEAYLFGRTDQLLQSALSGVAMRQQVTAHNIANVNTPRYQPQSVPFEAILQEAMGNVDRLRLSRTHPQHLSRDNKPIHSSVIVRNSHTMRNDENGVDIEREMAQLAKDTVLYPAVIQQVSNRFSAMRTAMQEGR